MYQFTGTSRYEYLHKNGDRGTTDLIRTKKRLQVG